MDVIFDQNQKTLLVKEWKIKEPEIIEGISDYIENNKLIEDYLTRCLRLGAIALKGVNISERVDFIQKRFNSLNNDFTVALTKYKEEISDNFEKQYKEFLDVLEGENGVKNCLDAHFGEKGSLIEIIDKFFGEKGKFLELFSLELPNSPFNLIKNEFIQKVNELSLRLENYFSGKEAEERIKEKTHLKGYDYEDQLEVVLNEIAEQFNDIVIPVQTIGTQARGKKGDFVIDISNNSNSKKLRFTIEAKSGKMSIMGKTGILQILDNSLKERNADYAIAAFRDIDLLPQTYQKSNGMLREYGNNKIICVANEEEWFPLKIAYKLARSRILMLHEKGNEVDSESISTKIASVINSLKTFNSIQTNLTELIKSVESIKNNIKSCKNSITHDLKDIQAELSIT
ncbi:MAG: hypothetical protein ACFE88_13940 [Candidatus Hermodarchaeota archaeon]